MALPTLSGHLLSVEKKARPLTDLYKTGTVKLIPKLRITVDSYVDETSFKTPLGFDFWKDNVYIHDIATNNFKIIGKDETFKKTVGQKGRGPGDLYLPHRIVVSRDRVMIWELGNSRFSLFTPQGDFIRHDSSIPKSESIYGIKKLDNGQLVIERRHTIGKKGNELRARVALGIYTPDLKPVKTITKQFIVTRRFNKNMKGSLPSIYPLALSWDVLPGNRIVYGFSDKFEISVLDVEKDKTTTFSHTYTPQKITESRKKVVLDNLYSGRLNPAKLAERKYYFFPEYLPAFGPVISDPQGNILVFSYEDEFHFRFKWFDAFDSTGKFIARVKIASPERGIVIFKNLSNEGFLWIFGLDENNDSLVAKYEMR